MDDSIWDLVDKLAAWQKEQDISDAKMAKKIGCARSTWATYRLKQKRPGWDFVRRVASSRGFRAIAMPYLLGKAEPASASD
jgi:transcriptional regulator with XRE-family HTH domain